MSPRAGGRRGHGASHGGAAMPPGDAALRALAPMLAVAASTLPAGPPGTWAYEPKYDGIRVLATVRDGIATLAMRSGRDATTAFPEIVDALSSLWMLGEEDGALVLDGEIVALAGDAPARFAALQPRLFVASPAVAARRARAIPTAFVAFDCLAVDGRLLLDRPWRVRRAALEALLHRWSRARSVPAVVRRRVRPSDVTDDGAALLDAERARGGEGVVAKDARATYQPGRRTAAWQKVRLEAVDEFLVAGVMAETGTAGARRSAPRLPRRIGALVLAEPTGDGTVRVVGTVGAGLTTATAEELARRLVDSVRDAPPRGAESWRDESARGRGARAVTWVEPSVVVSVRYLERTVQGRLRQPVLVGLRADLLADDVRPSAPRAAPTFDGPRAVAAAPPSIDVRAIAAAGRARRRTRTDALPGVPRAVGDAAAAARRALDAAMATEAGARTRTPVPIPDLVAHAAESIDAPPGDGPLVDACGWTWRVGAPVTLGVTNLAKPLGDGIAKADLLRYYATVAPYLLRALAGRPLVLRRHTDAPAGRSFHQQHASAAAPPGVVTARVGEDERPRFVGGALATLLYLAQLGAISMDPWHGRADASTLVDYAIVDLDPGPGAPFARVVDVARWVHDELLALGLASVPKTSGARGIHVVVPLPGDTPATAGRLLAELVATQVASRHREAATVLRSVSARAPGAVYVDFLQNVAGKSVASVYSARATPSLTVSTPFRWEEIGPGLDPRDWTIRSVPSRLADVGDLWGDAMQRGNDLEALRRVLRSVER